MRRHIALAGLVAACSGGKPAPAPVEPVNAPPTTEQVALESLVGSNVVAIMRTRPDLFMPLRYVKPILGDPPVPCWTELEQKLVAAYQFQVPKAGGGNTAYWVLEGDLRRAAVAGCVPTAVKATKVTARMEGDLLGFSASDGATTYAAWRGQYIVFGPRDLVTEALTAPADVRARWHGVLTSPYAAAPMWFASGDALLGNLFGVATTSYQIAFERIESAPSPYFAGRVVANYAAAGDAAIAARRIKQGELELPFDAPELVDSFKRMKVTQNGATVEIGFDLGMFGGIDAATLQGYAAKLLAAQAAR